jgi:DNA repair exonuclease SbcCD ATPase subunit
VEAQLDDSDVGEGQREREALEDRLAELRETRSKLESLREKIDSREESIRSLEQERSELEGELADLPETEQARVDHLEEELSRLRTRQQKLNSDISDLQSLVQYNEERVDADGSAFSGVADVGQTGDAESVTGQLLDSPSESVVCWTCGSTVDRSQITDTIDRLRSLREEKLSTLSTVKDDLEAATEEKRELESTDFEAVLGLHRRANQLEFEIDDLESELETVTDEISEVEAFVDRADDLRHRRATVAERLTDKRTRVEQIETEAVEAFNDHVASVLDVLEYQNVDRVWIERTERTVREGRQKVERTSFVLHVVRTTENGTAYEDTVEHLSESEREVVGLVFALAGYLVHDLHETVPFMLVDSLEAIDANRIAALVEYFADESEYLVLALLTEDAAALPDEYTYITSI